MTRKVPTEFMSVDSLNFDLINPRLAEFDIQQDSTEDEIIELLWEEMDVREIVQSIAASGFFLHEPLIVAKENGRNIVIEGNRRLAAVKVLLNDNLVKTREADERISDEEKEKLKELPVIKESREQAWRFLGFKHVNGPAKWTSYAKAKYIASVHKNYKVPLKDIASQIGDRHKTVQRLFRGLMVIEQAEAESLFSREDRFKKRFYFSHIYTGLDYSGISSFIGLNNAEDEAEEPVSKDKLGELKELCLWLYGSRKSDIAPIVESQNPDLRQLDAALKNRESIAALRSNQSLAVAFELTFPPRSIFEQSLINAKIQLQQAHKLFTTGYDNSLELLRVAGTIATLADELYENMERKRNPGKKERLME